MNFRCNRYTSLFFLIILLLAATPLPWNISYGADAGEAVLLVQIGEQKVLEKAAVPEQTGNLNMVRSQYSTMTESGERQYILGEGIALTDYLQAQDIRLEDVEYVYLYWKEGAPASFASKELLETKRYRYPAEAGTVTGQTYQPGTEVPPMLALRSVVSNEPKEDWNGLDSTAGLRLCYGQEKPDEIGSAMLKGNIQKITAILKEDSTYGQQTPPPQEPDFKISIRIGTDDIRQEIPYSLEQLEQMEKERQIYTSVNEKGEPEVILAEGIPVTTLIESAGVDFQDVAYLRFFYEDGLDSSFTKTFLFDRKRYRFPESEEVSPMLALRYTAGKEKNQQDWGSLSNQEGMKICYGQLTSSDVVSPMYGYNIRRMEIVAAPKMTEEDKAKAAVIDDSDVFGPAVSEETGEELAELPASLTFNVGYFGSEYVPRKIFTLDEIKSLPRVTQSYTAIDTSGKVVFETAVGVRLRDLLTAAGIDRNSVEKITFTFTENNEKKRISFARGFLLDTPRYFYPNLPLRWNGSGPTAGAALDALQVDTIIAFRDYRQQGATAPDFYMLNGYSRFRLVFGQTNTRTETASKQPKWIDAVEIQLLGSPPEEKGDSVRDASLIGADSKGAAAQQAQGPEEKLPIEAAKTAEAPDGTEQAEASQTLLSQSSNAKGVRIYEVDGMTAAQIPMAQNHHAAILAIGLSLLILGGAGGRYKRYIEERG